MELDYNSLKADDDFCVDLGQSVWLMDNHKWALFVWEKFRANVEGQFTLAHADYHWDGVYDFHSDEEKERALLDASVDSIRTLIEEENWIRFDSFIAPAVARGMFDSLHFYCLQGGEDGDVGIDEGLLASTGTLQVLHETPEAFAALASNSPLIFDLCLDLFNRSEDIQEGDLWSDAEVLQFLELVRPLIIGAVLVTVSLSFDYSGTPDDTRHLAALVLPRIQEWRSAGCRA